MTLSVVLLAVVSAYVVIGFGWALVFARTLRQAMRGDFAGEPAAQGAVWASRQGWWVTPLVLAFVVFAWPYVQGRIDGGWE